MMVLPAVAFLLLVPFQSILIVALGLRGAAPVVVAAILEILVCISPQLVMVSRASRPDQANEPKGGIRI
jgi:hypothetical protein